MKKLLFIFLAVIISLFFAATARAATPILALSTTGTSDYVQVNVSDADATSSVLMYFQKTNGTAGLQYLGMTNVNGVFSTQISTAAYSISPNSVVYVAVNNKNSNSLAWPYNSVTGSAITLSQTGSVMTVGQSITLTVNNVGTNLLYLLNNTNPQIANISISNSQVTIYANTYGQTVMTICALGTTSNCASDYITVQNSGAQPLTFSQSNLTVASGQSSTVTILNGTNTTGTGNYMILNNSNPSVIRASLSGSIITLSALSNNGTSALTVCSNDMSACGIITASAGNTSSSGLVFSQTAPTLTIGQTLNIIMSGGGSSYNISSNSNSAVVAASITNINNLTLVGNSAGSATVTVCSSSGNCGSITAIVSYTTSGPITLSQNNLWLQVGQSSSVVISGGSMPYSLSTTASSSSFVQSSLNNNILTLSGVAAGSTSINVCSAGGACTSLAVLVNGISTSGQLTFSNNNLSLIAGNSATVTLYGGGGYYISNSVNQNVASMTLSGNQINVSALTAGSANVTVCQTGGQCGVLYVSVTSNVAAVTLPTFSATNIKISVGQSVNVAIYGGASQNYYLSSNSNPAVVQATLSNGNTITIEGQSNGSTVINVCAASNNCSSLPVSVSSVSSIVTNPVAATTNPASTATASAMTAASSASAAVLLQMITSEAPLAFNGSVAAILLENGATRNTALETVALKQYINPLLSGLNLTTAQINQLNYFVTYGTPTTAKLGAGERAGVLNSYKQAYGILPITTAAWSDLLKIASGRFPSVLSTTVEEQARREFIKVYNRAAVMTDSNDLAAIKIIAYGLRPTARNTKSEQVAILTFKAVYGHAPVNSLAWNIVRAIAYSGAKR